jgi:hypothetical protein
VLPVFGDRHPTGLRSGRSACQLASSGLTQHDAGAPVDVPRVGLDLAVDDRLPEAPRGIHDDRSIVAGDRVDGERDAGSVSIDEQLHQHRHLRRRQCLPGSRLDVFAVADRVWRPQRPPAVSRVGDHVFGAGNVQKGAVLTREAGEAEIFRRRRGAHGDARI